MALAMDRNFMNVAAGYYYEGEYDANGKKLKPGFYVNEYGEKIFDDKLETQKLEALGKSSESATMNHEDPWFVVGSVGTQEKPISVIKTGIAGIGRSSYVFVFNSKNDVHAVLKAGDNVEYRTQSDIKKLFYPGIEFTFLDGKYVLVMVTL